MNRFYKISVMLIVLFVLIISIATSGFTADLNKVRGVYKAATMNEPLEGYWSKASTVTNAQVNYYPTCATYFFTLQCDSDSVSRANPAIIDIPIWMHHGVVGSYHISVNDTGNLINTGDTNDSLHVQFLFELLSSKGETMSFLSLLDSASTAGVIFVDTISNMSGEIDLSTEKYYWEHLRTNFVQPLTDASNTDTLVVDVEITLPYSTEYLNSVYGNAHGVTK